MLSEVKALEPELKQILYGCVEHVQATKAALYLSSSKDLNDKKFEVVTSYQFNDVSRRVVSAVDDLVDRLSVKRAPFFVNGLGSDMKFSEMLFRQGTDRMLAAPLFARGRLLGFIDMRDKAGKKPFDQSDLDAARRIADDICGLLGTKRLFGLEGIPLAEVSEAPQIVVSSQRGFGTQTEAEPAVERRTVLSSEAMHAIELARESIARRQMQAETRRLMSEADFEVVRLLLPAALAIPGAVLACFSAIGHAELPQAIVAIATVTADAMELLQRHLQGWLRRMNHPTIVFEPTDPLLIYPFGMQVVPVSASGISTILSAPVNPQSWDGLVLTVAFERTPEAQGERALNMFLHQVEQSVETAIAAGAGRNDRQRVAEKLLEPDFQKFPELVKHSMQVSALAAKFAIAIGLPPQQVETVRLAGLVHDVGLRLLDYERLYRKPNVTAEEMRALAEHVIVGAALVEPVLGPDVAQAVLRHHERVDGKGYPSRMSGHTIPGAARIIQICDAWVSMTSAHSYQPPVSEEEGAWRLKQGAGTQFDEALTAQFLKHLPELTA